jgi:uncharacterized protein (TIGR03089 family)
VHYLGRVRTPADVLADLLADDPSRPALTFYDDTPGPTSGERVELSRKVLGTWVAKAANALQEDFDVHPGSVVRLDLPSPHWRALYWALAVWSVGATLTVDAHEGADVLVTTRPDSAEAEDADEVVAVTLPALAHGYATALRSGVMDEAREIATYGDVFTAWDEPSPTDPALVVDGRRTAYQDVVPERPSGQGGRVLVTTEDLGTLLRQVLRVWGGSGSVVLVRGGSPRVDDPRMTSEGVTGGPGPAARGRAAD